MYNEILLKDLKSQSNITSYRSEIYGERRAFLKPKFSDFSLTETEYKENARNRKRKGDSTEKTCIIMAFVGGIFGFVVGLVIYPKGGCVIGGMLGVFFGPVLASSMLGTNAPSTNESNYSFAMTEYETATELRKEILHERKQDEIAKVHREKILKERLQKQKTADHWLNLTPFQFEEEVALRLRQSGKVDSARVTKKSGDGGIDIWAKKNNQDIIIQCKAHANPIGIRAARELLGVKVETKVPRAILVSRSTFTGSVHDFAEVNGIELIDLNGLVRLAGKSELPTVETAKTNYAEKKPPKGHIPSSNDKQRCLAVNKQNNRCGLRALDGSEYCHIHKNVEHRKHHPDLKTTPPIKSERKPKEGNETSKVTVDLFLETLLFGDSSLSSYKPKANWENEPITASQEEYLTKNGFDCSGFKKGCAAKLIDNLGVRREQGLASPRMVRYLLKSGYPQAHKMSFKDAKVAMDKLSKLWESEKRAQIHK